MSKPRENAAEGRANLARPSLCLLLTTGAFLALTLVAPAAWAEQPEPVALTETNPLSSQAQPAASTEPFIIGRGDGAIATVVNPFGGRTHSPIAADVNPDNQVEIYANATCTDPPVAGGIVDELEGEGIQVDVEPDSNTTFSAVQIDPTDPGQPSICSKPIKYWTSSTASEPPGEEPPAKELPGGEPPVVKPPTVASRPAAAPLAPRLKTAPAGPANGNTPRIVGSAAGADSVKIFSNSSCAGAPVATVSPAQLDSGVQLRVPDNSTTDFTGISTANSKQSFCSPPATYIEDSTPPRTRITMGPGAKTRHPKVIFRFADTSGDPLGTSFICKVDHHKWKACHSPFKLRNLSYSRHVLQVRGTDVIGNAEAKAAKRSFKVIH
ncbi:MAG: hypothetical protein QOF13_1379 [Solirubrobacterales bacterium]|jgi:hypothetical protein|nr:hypothetical protein [Solirubrobacterales bacterium]